MKKIVITIFCITCMSVSVIAQSGVRIGNYEFHVKKAEKDSAIQVFAEEDPCISCPSENETRSKPKTKIKSYPYHKSDFFGGIGFVLPDNSNNYYTVLGNKSISVDAGWMHRYQLARRFALGATLNYTYYNYKFRDVISDPSFRDEVLNSKDFTMEDVRKQVYRSHNIAVSAFTRFYLIPPKNRGNDGLYIDLGAQADVAVDMYCFIDTYSEGKKKFYNDYAFNPFIASAYVRAGSGSGAIFARHRLTDVYNSKVLPIDLPPITFGVQIIF